MDAGLISQFDHLEGQIAKAETRLQSLLDGDVARRLITIPGVGPATAATLMAEIGDIHRFDDVDQLLAYARYISLGGWMELRDARGIRGGASVATTTKKGRGSCSWQLREDDQPTQRRRALSPTSGNACERSGWRGMWASAERAGS